MSSLALRVLSAAIGLPILVGACVWGERPFIVLVVVLALVGRLEITRAYEKIGIHPDTLLSVLGALAPASVLFLRMPLGAGMPAAPLPLLLMLACALIVASLWETGVASHEREIHTGRRVAYGLLCGAYVSLFGGVALLRICPWNGPQGLWPLLSGGAGVVLVTASCTMAGDTGAYFVGRALGRHKLAEGLSPKKTLEGFFGGIVASVGVGAGVGALLLGSWAFGLVVGVVAGILGPLGDLFKSALKREIGIKDFGTVIPGHGGVLDRFDSLLFTAPVVMLLAVTTGPW